MPERQFSIGSLRQTSREDRGSVAAVEKSEEEPIHVLLVKALLRAEVEIVGIYCKQSINYLDN